MLVDKTDKEIFTAEDAEIAEGKNKKKEKAKDGEEAEKRKRRVKRSKLLIYDPSSLHFAAISLRSKR